MTDNGETAPTAYAQIRQAIVEGRYLPGQRLIEQRIAEEFTLSRTPVREALRRLEAEGLVTSERNRGAAVRSVSVDEVGDLYELRARLESYACELAATRHDNQDLAELDSAIVAFGEAIDRDAGSDLDRVRALDQANRRFHGAIHAASRHARLASHLERTTDIPLVFQAFRQFDAEQTRRSHRFHKMIRDLIATGNGSRAGALMYEHVLQGRDTLVARINSTDTGDIAELFTDNTTGNRVGREQP